MSTGCTALVASTAEGARIAVEAGNSNHVCTGRISDSHPPIRWFAHAVEEAGSPRWPPDKLLGSREKPDVSERGKGDLAARLLQAEVLDISPRDLNGR